jgi:hypothetical protein
LITKSEEWFPYGSSRQFQGLGIVGAHITDSGNILQSNILRGIKNFIQECTIVSASELPLPVFILYVDHGSRKLEHDMQCYVSCPDFPDRQSLNAVKLLTEI